MKTNSLQFYCLCLLLLSCNGFSANNAKQLIQQYQAAHALNMQQIKVAANKNLQDWLVHVKQNSADIQAPTSTHLNLYPITSKLLTPGVVVKQQLKTSMPHPTFFIGTDLRSLAWLKKHSQKLIAINARGYVVNVASDTDFQNLQTQYPDLKLMPMPADEISKWLHIQHIPFLLMGRDVIQ